ncbi:hypothetical protein OPV22_009399 [Ensete ventricosum]|uniref:Uncharacterized protein n=1 Tax=Ensete ventricosum TaxID=4639 RepID=A0AAV8RD84_ENSVE|nr:hypothetical protein OPV22_009399 [Ensete ventricosum]
MSAIGWGSEWRMSAVGSVAMAFVLVLKHRGRGNREGLRGRFEKHSTAASKEERKLRSFRLFGSSSLPPLYWKKVSNDNGDCSRGDGVDDNSAMVRWRKQNVRAPRCRLNNNEASDEAVRGRSEGEEGDPSRPNLSANATTSLNSRKRVRLHGKVAEDSNAVDTAPVPRKLRSAINKRSSHSSSRAMPDAKKKHHGSSGGVDLLYRNGGRRCKPSMLLDSLTKDEEEVLEALCALSRMLPVGTRVADKENRRLSYHQDNNSTTVPHSEAPNEEGEGQLLQQCTASGIRVPSSCMEKPLDETMEEENIFSKQPLTVCARQTIDSDLSRIKERGTNITPLSENEPPEGSVRYFAKLSSPSGVLTHTTGNRALQPIQCDAFTAIPPCKLDMLQPNRRVESPALGGNKVQQVEHNGENSAKRVCQEGIVPLHIHPSSCNTAARLVSSRIDLPTKKVLPDDISSWKKCAIHVFIGHLIKNDQENEEERKTLLPPEVSRPVDGSKSCAPANDEKVGLQNSVAEKNKHEGRAEVLCDRRYMPAHQSSVSSDAKQKQACDFASLPGNGDASSSAKGAKSAGQVHSPFRHAQVPHHPFVPFPFPHVPPYASPYSEKLVAVTTQQVQLQVPNYVGHPFFGPQMDEQQQYQQQQIWQAHFAQYRSLVGIAALQNDRLHDSSASTSRIVQASSTLPSFPPVQMQGGSSSQHQLLGNASSSSSSKAKPHQQPRSLRGGRFQHEGPRSAAAASQHRTIMKNDTI